MNQNNPPEPDRIRASDADRDAVAHRLRDALSEGRLDIEEHNERLEATYRAKTVGELVPLTEDLPAGAGDTVAAPVSHGPVRPAHGTERIVDSPPTSRMAVAVMGGADRSGPWIAPGSFTAMAVMGGVNLDLRNARFTQKETTIWCCPVMGGIGVTVPYDVQVRVHGIPIMGGFGMEGNAPNNLGPDSPIVHIRGIAIMGGVMVEYRSWNDDEDDEDD